MPTSALALAVPCRQCGAKAGERCTRKDGLPASRSHVNRTPVQPCGSYGGYQRHKRLGEDPCERCREANRRYLAEYRNQHPARREDDIRALRARREAIRLLIERHQTEFRDLLRDLHETA